MDKWGQIKPPSDLIFGGNPAMLGDDKGGAGEDLKKIERNTRETADFLSLRRETLGESNRTLGASFAFRRV